MGRKERNKGGEFSTENQSGGGGYGANRKSRNFSKDNAVSVSDLSFLRKQVDPETIKYFSEIANVIEGNEKDPDERSVICGNALEEARGKEVELATDYIISHTMQILLEGCSLDYLCTFLRNSAKSFSHIAMDRSGSHVAESALKSLAMHSQDNESYSLIEETLSKLCKAIVVNPVDIMCNSYGSHVLRRLICLCKGVPAESSEQRGTKSSAMLAERLNLRSSQLDNDELHQKPQFSDQLKFLISEMLNPSKVDIATLQQNQSSSLVLQTALKLLAGDELELCRIIPILLGCHTKSIVEGNMIEVSSLKKVMRLVENNAFSHLMEVILAVAPDTLYDEILVKVFKNSLLKMSLHPSANFVVQALISHARSQEHVKLMWEELGSKFKNLLEMGRFGVVAVLLAASQHLHIHEHECCKALADAVGWTTESSAPIISRILFIDNYFYYSGDKANWNWPNGARMHVLGSLILQSVFKFPSEHIQAYITSIISLEDNQVLIASKDPSGARVIEAFLSSSASAKQKRKLVIKLRGHYGELSVTPSGSFTVDKLFDVSNLSLREAIVTELVPVQTELSKTKQGPYLLKKLDVEGFAKRPDQWRSRQTSKESTYNEFYETFGPSKEENKKKSLSRSENFLSDNHNRKSQPEKLDIMRTDNRGKFNDMRKEIETHFSATPFLAHQKTGKKRKMEKSSDGSKFVEDGKSLPTKKEKKRPKGDK